MGRYTIPTFTRRGGRVGVKEDYKEFYTVQGQHAEVNSEYWLLVCEWVKLCRT